MGESFDQLGQWMAGILPASLAAPQATVGGALLGAGAALVAALVALFAAVALRNGYLTVRTTAQMKHADFRQAWINSLREEMVTFQSLAVETITRDEKWQQKLAASCTKILLLMNPKDPDYQKLLDALHAAMSDWKVAPDELLDAHADLIMLCQDILKREWNVTKREMHAVSHFFWVRWLLAIGRAFAWFVVRLYRHVLRPAWLWLYPRAIEPGVQKLPVWATWGVRWVSQKRQGRIARARIAPKPNSVDKSEMKERQEGLASLLSTTGAGGPPTSAPTPR